MKTVGYLILPSTFFSILLEKCSFGIGVKSSSSFLLSKSIYFIENHNHRFLMRIDFHENLIHRINVIFETFVRNIYYMNQLNQPRELRQA